MRGRFVVIEGGEAAGKSTQAQRLAWRLEALLTNQPGGTWLGRSIREIVLNPMNASLDDRSEALLLAADKAQHVAEVIEPTLAMGRSVVCDRYVASMIAYQGYGRGIDRTELRRLVEFATGGLRPDLTLLLDAPDEDIAARLGERPDRFETESLEFHRRVRAGYRELAAADPQGWAVVDASGDVDEVAARIAEVVAERLGQP